LEQTGDLRCVSDSLVGAGRPGRWRFGLFGTAHAMVIDVLQFPEVVAEIAI
jgi:hypothetical protein